MFAGVRGIKPPDIGRDCVVRQDVWHGTETACLASLGCSHGTNVRGASSRSHRHQRKDLGPTCMSLGWMRYRGYWAVDCGNIRLGKTRWLMQRHFCDYSWAVAPAVAAPACCLHTTSLRLMRLGRTSYSSGVLAPCATALQIDAIAGPSGSYLHQQHATMT